MAAVLAALAVIPLGAVPARAQLPAAVAPAAPLPASNGYWFAGADGGVFALGGAPFVGSARARRLNRPIVAMARTRTGRGYWLAASDGGIFAFGDAGFFGSAGAINLNRPIVGMAATPSGQGYWLVASDGGIFNYGDAVFRGSTGAIALNRPIVGMAPTPTGKGYWLVASDGGIFNFGDAPFRGSTGALKLNRPIVGMAPTPGGSGYWLVASDGGIFNFGDAVFRGSTGATRLNRPVIGVAAAPRGLGYWLVASDGGIFAFGGAPFSGSTGNVRLVAPIVAMAAAPPPRPAPEVGIFFYPWYARLDLDGGWRHWEANGNGPPSDVASNFYPSRGAYSSSDPAVLNAQMAEIKAAGIDVVISSWWGRGSYEDGVLPKVAAAAAAQGLRLAILHEPYGGRSVSSTEQDIAYLRSTFGVRDFYLFDMRLPVGGWAGVRARLGDVRLFGQSNNLTAVRNGDYADYALGAGFDGLFSYDPVRYAPADFAGFCGFARQVRMTCAPSVAPGYVATRTKPTDTRVVARNGGERYNAQWSGALDGGAEIVTITSYNEWHEGSQIEPAQPYCFSDGICSPAYEGNFGAFGPAAPTAYLDATRIWTEAFRRF